jgi:Cu/Ag efflux protein CusF
MRLSTAMMLLNLTLGAGVLIGYQWSARDLGRPPSPVTSGRADARPDTGIWTVKGIVRGVIPAQNLVVVTHEPIPGLMGAMTMRFRVEPSRPLERLSAGDLIEFTLERRGTELVVVALRKEGEH